MQAWVYEHFPTLCRDCCRLSASYVEDYPRALKWKPKRDKGLVLPFRKTFMRSILIRYVGHHMKRIE